MADQPMAAGQRPTGLWLMCINQLLTISVHVSVPDPQEGRFMRVRLKADGRLVEILPDGSEQALPPTPESLQRVTTASFATAPVAYRPPAPTDEASYARSVRARTRLTQAEFASRIGVPIETVRNWEQGKRSPRGPARALLRLIDGAPETAFSVLGKKRA
jgi:putative transcriptional regulator